MQTLTTGQSLLLRLLALGIRGERAELAAPLGPEDWAELRILALQHRLLPLLAETLAPGRALEGLPGEWAALRESARQRTAHQAARTAEFLLLLDELDAQGLRPAVLKGLICRTLYPQPEQRASNDEDLLISPGDYPRYHEALLSAGLRLLDPEQPTEDADEVSYVDPERDLVVELHLLPFPPEGIGGAYNAAFDGALERCVSLPVYGQPVRTLQPTDHLLYLICHACKHLLYSGVGVRQICDICLFAREFAAQIDWPRLRGDCRRLELDRAAAAFFQIGARHLDIPAPTAFEDPETDELPLLLDCLSAGLYGAEDPDRVHSRAFTLSAASAGGEGKLRRGALRALFPPASYLEGHYPYTRGRPWLLPAAWAQRLWHYALREKGSPARSLQIGQERIALLRRYKLIP